LKNSLFILVVILFLGLIGGAALASGDAGLPLLRQVSNENASTIDSTPEKSQLLALAVLVTVGSLVGMGVGLAGLFYFLNRQVKTSGEVESKPFDFSLETEGNSLGAVIQQNAFMIALTVGLLLVGLMVTLAITTGAIF
jgi:hypothetical protein